MDRTAAEAALVKLARQFEGAWKKTRAKSFQGTVVFETKNTTYRFVNGVFTGRAQRAPVSFPVWEAPAFMNNVELLGFLYQERGLWSLSPEWKWGSLAVITTSANTLTLTTPTISYDQHEPTCPTVRSTGSGIRSTAAPVRRSA